MLTSRSIPWLRLVLPLTLGLLLRLFFIHHNPVLSGDPLIYGGIATDLLRHGVYGFAGHPHTLIRLPGYPFFLAACFEVFGVGRYYPVLYLQAVIDLGTCLVLALLAARLAPAGLERRAATGTLWLAALCPFTACYTAAPLTETLEIFSITYALYCFARALNLGGEAARVKAGWLAGATVAWILAALLRPDGALLGVTLWAALVLYGLRSGETRRVLKLAGLSALGSLLAFVPWTIRNEYTLHVFEPLAPRYATDPGEATDPGFQRWTKTVCADLVCTIEVYWAAGDDPILLDNLPSRAFDSPAQRRETAALLADYNRSTTITPALDARFDALARQRIHDHPVRNQIGLPLLRLADMWLRPRVELFNIDPRWWDYRAQGPDTILAGALGLLNAGYLLLALAGAARRPPLLGVFVSFTLLRCLLLLTIEAPEPRYTLECYPMVLVLGGVAVAGLAKRRKTAWH